MASDPPMPDDDDSFAEDLRRASEGDAEARNRLWANHYEMLRQCAAEWLAGERRRGYHRDVSLGGTDIVDLAYARMRDRVAAMANGKQYFFAAFYWQCLWIVVDHYRRTRKHKGHGDMERVEFHPSALAGNSMHIDPVELFDLVDSLGKYGSRVRDIAMLKVFESRPVEGKPGATRELTNAEVAEEFGISQRTVEDEWPFAKAILTKLIADLGKS